MKQHPCILYECASWSVALRKE